MRPVRLTTATALTCLVIAAPLAGAPAHAAPDDRFVALGDSYSSGTGTGSYLDDGTSCQRSTRAFPSLVAASGDLDLDLRACAGATTADVTAAQLSALSSSTDRVSISVGGNDAAFADVLTECAQPGWASDCTSSIDAAQATISRTLPDRLSTLYSSIRSAAPNASVVVVGYPRLFMGEDCNALTWFAPEEQTRLNATADQLNSRLRSAASAAGFTFVDPTTPFVGHAVCDDPEWVNGLSNPISESYHPNVAGHRDGYSPIVGGPVTGTATTVTRATSRKADAGAAEQTERQRRRAEVDRRIEPKTVQLPDLDSPRIRRAAARAGVDLDSPASIAAADRAWSAHQAQARR